MFSYLRRLFILIVLSQFNLHCQMKTNLPEFNTEICHPNNNYEVTPVMDYITTLEGTPASLPYGSTSGQWGSSGKMWTKQKGTPIGFGITYYSYYENKYYEIQQDLEHDYMKEMTTRCYPISDKGEGALNEFITLQDYNNSYEEYRNTYSPFSTLVFGFAPKGMVVVWICYANISIEVGRYTAHVLNDEKKIKECEAKLLSTYRIEPETHKELIESMSIPKASSQLWENYRIKYDWSFNVTSTNHNFRFLALDNDLYNGEFESLYRPFVSNPEVKKRAIPEILNIYWETGKNERYISRIFFNWDKTNEKLKASGIQDNFFNIKIKEDNSELSIDLNGKPIEVDSIRIYPNSHLRFRDSYQD